MEGGFCGDGVGSISKSLYSGSMSDGGIAQNVVNELAGIGKQVVADTAKLGVDVISNTVETLATGGGGQHVNSASQGKSEGAGGGDPFDDLKQRKEAEARRRLQQVQQELEAYRAQRLRGQQQQEQARQQEKMTELKMNETRKRQQRDIIDRMTKPFQGTGEIGKNIVG